MPEKRVHLIETHWQPTTLHPGAHAQTPMFARTLTACPWQTLNSVTNKKGLSNICYELKIEINNNIIITDITVYEIPQ
jgi:hypothetical protein